MLLNQLLTPYKIILASGSPRRRELMAGAGIEFTVAGGYEVEEVYPDTLAAEDVPLFLANLKSESYPHKLSDNEIVITADTVVIIENQILGKPRDRDDAISILEKLSGNRHTVITGVVIRTATATKKFSASSDVFFRSLDQDEIEFYVDNYKPYDKAGAYGIQEWIGYVGIERIEGSFYNVMGLPIQQLFLNLKTLLKP